MSEGIPKLFLRDSDNKKIKGRICYITLFRFIWRILAQRRQIPFAVFLLYKISLVLFQFKWCMFFIFLRSLGKPRGVDWINGPLVESTVLSLSFKNKFCKNSSKYISSQDVPCISFVLFQLLQYEYFSSDFLFLHFKQRKCKYFIPVVKHSLRRCESTTE